MSRWIKLGLSLGITGVSFWWTFRDTQWSEMWASLSSANWLMLLPYLVALGLIHVARTLRWGNLLSPQEHVPFKKLNEASAIGFMMLVILPFRLGEFARPFLIAERSSIRRSAAMTSVVFERIVDGVFIAILLRGLMFFLPEEGEGIARIRIGANLMFMVFFGGFLFLLLARWQPERVVGLMRKTVGRLAPNLTEKVVHIVEGFVGALRALPDARNMAAFFGLTLLYWVINGFSMSFLANAFDCSGGTAVNCQPLHLTSFQGFVVLCVLVAGLMIPAAPGSAGTFQGSIKLALLIFVPEAVWKSSGGAFANALWVVQIAQQILVGLVFMLISHSSFSEIAGKLSEEERQQRGEAAQHEHGSNA